MYKILISLALSITPILTLAAGKIYTWQDADGNIVYGDRPPTGATAEEIHIQGKKKAAVIVDEEQLEGEWFGSSNEGGQTKMTINGNGTIRFLQTKADQSTINYQGIWTLERQTLTVITEFTQTAEPNRDFIRSVEPMELTYNILAFNDTDMEMIIEGERFNLRKTVR